MNLTEEDPELETALLDLCRRYEETKTFRDAGEKARVHVSADLMAFVIKHDWLGCKIITRTHTVTYSPGPRTPSLARLKTALLKLGVAPDIIERAEEMALPAMASPGSVRVTPRAETAAV